MKIIYFFKFYKIPGAASVATMAVGTMLGGLVIRYTKPSARKIAIFVTIVECMSTMGIFSSMFLNCPTPQFKGLELIQNPQLQMCNTGCECSTQAFQPVCGPDRKYNYFSPCFAGCKSYDKFSSVRISLNSFFSVLLFWGFFK